MALKCIKCGKNQSQVNAMHRFPNDAIFCKMWMIACNIERKPSCGFLCSDHFVAEDYIDARAREYGGHIRLKRGAVPSLFQEQFVTTAREESLDNSTSSQSNSVVNKEFPEIMPTVNVELPLTSSTATETGDVNTSHITTPRIAKPAIKLKVPLQSKSVKICRLEAQKRRLINKIKTRNRLRSHLSENMISSDTDNTFKILRQQKYPMTVFLDSVQNRCRACLLQSDIMFSLFSKTEQDIEFITMFTYLVPEQVSSSPDTLPQFLCHTCANLLQTSYNFKKSCEKSQSVLAQQCNTQTSVSKKTSSLPFAENVPIAATDSIGSIKKGVVRDAAKRQLCIVCGKLFKRSSYLKVHMKIHTEERNYKCCICNKKFIQATSLKIHKRIHTGERPLSCTVCHKSFRTLSAFNHHGATHATEKKYICEICNKAFSALRYLNQHSQIHGTVRCGTCSKTFVSLSILNQHERVHTKEKPFLCSTCGKCYSRAIHLNAHMRSHTGDKPFVCKECGKGFRQSGDLHVHMRIHSGQKNNICSTCSKAFVTSSALNKHLRIHTGERPYKCSVCDKSFSESYALVRHTRVHTGDKPYKCSVCQQGFSQSTSLKKHSKLHMQLHVSN